MKKILLFLLLIPFICLGQTSDATLTTQAQQIKNETVAGANTANRIGTHLQNLVYSKKSFFVDGTASGTDTYSVTLSNGAITALTSQWFVIKFTNANTGAATLNINSIGATALKKTDGSALSAGDIDAGSVHILAYDGTNLQVLSISSGGGSSISDAAFSSAWNGNTTEGASKNVLYDELINTQSVYNVEYYGAVHNYQYATDANITSGTDALTTTASIFTLADVGKSIRVYGAGAAGVDLLTTIDGYTSGTSVSVATNASTTVANAKIEFATDDTPGVQAAINAAFAAGGGTVYLPNGVYSFFGALVTSVDAINPNCQVYIPLRTGATYNKRLGITILGESATTIPGGPYATQSQINLNGNGVVIRSMISGSGTLPAVWGSSYDNALFGNSNFTNVTWQNIYTITKSRQGTSNIAPTMSAWRVNYLSAKQFYDCVADTESASIDSAEPVAETYGFYMSTTGQADEHTYFENLTAINYYYGYRIDEHCGWDRLTAYTCYSGMVIGGVRTHPITGGGQYLNAWSKYGITFLGDKYVDINYAGESWFHSPNPSKWFNRVADIYFPSNQDVDGIIRGVVTRAYDTSTEEPMSISGTWTGNLRVLDISSNKTIVRSTTTTPTSYVSNLLSSGIIQDYIENNRGSLASYGGSLVGGSTATSGTLFGLTYADKYFVFSGGSSSLGMGVGTVTNDPLVLGTNNAEVMRIEGNGNTTIKTNLGVGGNSTSPGQFYILEDMDNGTNYTLFQVGSQSANITYTLPTGVPTTSGAKLTATTAGVMSWVDELAGSATLNFDLTSVNSEDLTITVTGAADGDFCSIGVPNASATANVIYTAWTSGTNTVTVRASRIDVATGANPASGTFKTKVFKKKL